MGNTSTKTSLVLESKPLELVHPKLPNNTYKKTLGQEIIVTDLPLNDEHEYLAWVDKLKQNPGVEVEGVLNPVNYSYKKTGMCGSSGAAKISFDNYPFILKQTIKDRLQAQTRKFKQNQLWYLLYTMAAVGFKFHAKRTKIGDIRPLNIFINQDGQIKMATQYTWPNEPNNYQKALRAHQKTYLAPEEIKNLQIGYSQSISNLGPAEIFSAGLTALDTALLEDSEKLYTKNKNLDFDLLINMKQRLKSDHDYGQLLKHVILNMIETYPEDRILFEELYEWLQSYSEYILNLDPFSSEELPQKIKKTADENPIKLKPRPENEGFLKNYQKSKLIKKAESRELQFEQIQSKEHEPQPQIEKLNNPLMNGDWGIQSKQYVVKQEAEALKNRPSEHSHQKLLKKYLSEKELHRNRFTNQSPSKHKPKVVITYQSGKSKPKDSSFGYVPDAKRREEMWTQTMGLNQPPELNERREGKNMERRNYKLQNELMTETKRIRDRSSSTLKRIQDTIQLSKKMFPSPPHYHGI